MIQCGIYCPLPSFSEKKHIKDLEEKFALKAVSR